MITIHDSRRDMESSDFFDNTCVSLKIIFLFLQSILKKNIFVCVYMTLDESDFFNNTYDSLKIIFLFLQSILKKNIFICVYMTLDETWKVVIFLTTLMIHWKNYFFVSHTNTKKKYFYLCLHDLDEIDFFDNTYDSLKNYFFVSHTNTKKKYFCLCLHDSRRD